MSRALELCRLLVVAPEEAAQSVLQRPLESSTVVLLLWGVFAQAVSQALSAGHAPLGLAASFLAALIAASVAILLGGALIHLSAGLLGGNGSAGDLVRVLALVYAPNIFLPAFALAGDGALFLARVLIGLWQLWILVVGVREAHRLSTSTAASAVIIPAVFLLFALPLAGISVLMLGLLSAMG
ncbi:MAG: Yip1 family protein [Pseudomonadota bacterium]